MRHNSTNDIFLVDSFDGYDDHIDYLNHLFEELQLCCVEAANYPDVLEFKMSACYIGLINRQERAPEPSMEANKTATATDTTEEDIIKASVVILNAQEAVVPKPKKQRRRRNKKQQANKGQTAAEGSNKVNQSRSKTSSNTFSGSAETLVTPRPISSSAGPWWDDTSDSDASSMNPSGTTPDVFTEGNSIKEIINGRNEWTKNWAAKPVLTKSEDFGSFKTIPSSSFPQLNVGPSVPSTYQSRDPQEDWSYPAVPKEPLGLIYLFSTPHHQSLNAVGEVRIGIILHEKYRGYGFAQQAVQLVVEYAFDELKCHRIQATLLQTPLKAHALKLFTRERFGHEGTHRSAFFSPLEHEWKDTTTMAMLDTEWVIRSSLRGAPPTLWDEMFLRHERERDILLRWEQSGKEEERRLLKRTSSMETIRYETGSSSRDEKRETQTVGMEEFVDDQEYLAAAGYEDGDLASGEDEEDHPDTKRQNFGGAHGYSTPPLVSSTASAAGGSAQTPSSPAMFSRLHSGQDHDGDSNSSDGSWDAMETSSNSSFDRLSDSS